MAVYITLIRGGPKIKVWPKVTRCLDPRATFLPDDDKDDREMGFDFGPENRPFPPRFTTTLSPDNGSDSSLTCNKYTSKRNVHII